MGRKVIICKNWDDIDGMENEDYRIEVSSERDSGYIIYKDYSRRPWYLNTHMFYGGETTIAYQRILRRHGFPVKIV